MAGGEIDRYEIMGTDQLSHSVAIHEAGHALVVLALGESFKQISTEPRMDGGVETLGHIELENARYERDAQLGPDDCARVERIVMILLSGMLAERRWHERTKNGRSDRRAIERRAEHDARHYWPLIGLLERNGTRPGGAALVDVLWDCLNRLVEQTGDAFWRRVEGLARAVAGGRTLSWDEALAVVDETESRHGLPPIRESWLIGLAS